MRLSVVIPAHDEASSIAETLGGLADVLERESIDYELLVVDDASTDDTLGVVESLASRNPRVRGVRSQLPRGFGYAVRAGLDLFEGDAVAIVMADASDAPEDLVTYHRLLEAGYDCAFGSRFVPGASTDGYPALKLMLNRAANVFVRLLFRHGYNDTTNAFKAYRREVVESVQPLLSNHFNLTVELPLKAIVRGHSYAVCPVSWRNRKHGVSKLSIQEMGSRYLFIVLYVWLEHHLSRGDYRIPAGSADDAHSRDVDRRDARARQRLRPAEVVGASRRQRDRRDGGERGQTRADDDPRRVGQAAGDADPGGPASAGDRQRRA
ncbi:MAG TPA: glycosyltransferase family 2 protein [Gaiellaceae bacterium]|jgi:dolichol-phosphate mannosyltransferase|nr:glycosyltransferase family 2 protein [Gaiellaceae bacterium]